VANGPSSRAGRFAFRRVRSDSRICGSLTQDTGHGTGWKLQAGSITLIWASPTQFNHYIYTDSTGAEYSLSVSNNNVRTSREGVYVSYDAIANHLYSTDGSFWYTTSRGNPNRPQVANRLNKWIVEPQNQTTGSGCVVRRRLGLLTQPLDR
jgi:hypothetical protein